MTQRSYRCHAVIVLASILGQILGQQSAFAGNEANFVLYDHHTDKKGETEINAFSDFSSAAKGDEPYNAQLVEFEHALTDRWTAAVSFEGDKSENEDYEFGGWRLGSRYRVFDYGAFLNPVLYVEYENLKPAHRYLLEVTGRTDASDEPETTEHELVSKLIVGHDITSKLDAAFNWIDATNLDSGRWEFGYAMGLNYALVGNLDHEAEERDEQDSGSRAGRFNELEAWTVKDVKVGAELYGGLGDSTLGLTLDPDRTQQYAGLNLLVEFSGGAHVMVGGAAGLTSQSESGLLRLMISYEFE